MSASEKNGKFYVVGGPVQPDRACYMSRDADEILLRRLLDGDYCHVLAQRNTGKTSLAAHTAWSLRDREVRVAVVDLTQLKLDDPEQSAGRWYYNIAYRIVRDLRLKSDLQSWWSDHGGLTHEQRLVEFFFDIVLSGTEHRYVVFVDRLEALAGHPLADGFLNAIRACYDARANEAEFQRLTFCLLGTGTPDEFVKNVQDSPFAISANVPLGDFRRNEISELANGLGQEGVDTEQVVSRIWWWTNGHPYLTQKLFRGLSRRNDEVLDAETVDDLVATQFLTPTAPEEEAHLSFVASRLLRHNSTRVARLSLYGKIRKGGEVIAHSSSKPQQELLAAGVVVENAAGHLVIRNNIYGEVFSARWVNQNLPFGWRRLGIAAAVAALMIAVPVWYTKYLPRPYERALTAATQDYEVALDAYESLAFFPGYGDRAEQLFADFLLRQSQRAVTLDEAMRTHKQLLRLPGTEEAAAEALAEFWDRHSNSLALRGERDGALLAQLNSLDVPTELRRRKVSALIGEDYKQLLSTIRIGNYLRAVRANPEASRLTVLDDQHTVHLWRLSADAPPTAERQFELAAEERVVLRQRLQVSAPPEVSRMALVVKTDHPRPADVAIRLQAPSGAVTVLQLADAGKADGEYRFDSARMPALAGLLGDDASGTWIAYFADVERGVTGYLLDWSIDIAGGSARPPADVDRSAQLIPEPMRTTLVRSELDSTGQRALVWPEDSGVSGDILVWDLASASVIARIPRDQGVATARFLLGGSQVMTRDGGLLRFWDAATGKLSGEVPLADTEAAPVVSGNGRFLVLQIARDDGSRGFQVWDVASLQPVGSVISAENASMVAVDGMGYYLAVGSNDSFLRIWSLRDATLFREFAQADVAVRMEFDPLGRWLVSEDREHNLRVWDVAGARNYPVIERTGREPWQFTFAAGSQRMLIGSGGRSYDVVTLPEGRVTGVSVRHPAPVAANAAILSVDRNTDLRPGLYESLSLALTHDGLQEIKLWRSPPDAASGAPADGAATVSQAALSYDGRYIALGGVDGSVRVVPADNELLVLSTLTETEMLHTSAIHRIVFSQDATLLASGSTTGEVFLWDTATAAPLPVSVRHQDEAIVDLLFYGRKPAVADTDDSFANQATARPTEPPVLISASRGLILVTNTATGERLAEMRVQGGEPRLSLSFDGGKVMVAGASGGLVLWDWRNDVQETFATGDASAVLGAFAGDGRSLFTTTASGELSIWDIDTRSRIGEVIAAPGPVDEMWTFAGNDMLVLRSGHWIQGYNMISLDGVRQGLEAYRSLLLPESTSGLQPDPQARLARVLSRVHSSRPVVLELSLDAMQFVPVEGEAEALQTEWRGRLAYDDNFASQFGGL